MLHDEKPPLDADTLAHFGVKGMHWGRRKAAPPTYFKTSKRNYSGGPKPTSSSRNVAPPKKHSKAKKILVGAALVGGAAAAAAILGRSGSNMVVTNATNHLDLGPAGARAAQSFTNHLDLGSSVVNSASYSHVLSTPLSSLNVQNLYDIARG
jgi:hypothetical protein